MSTAVPVLRVSDLDAALAFYCHLGFGETFRHQFAVGLPWYAGVARDGAVIHLSEHTGDARPRGLVVLFVDDFDALVAVTGAEATTESWGRMFTVSDPDGNRLRVTEQVSGSSGQ